MAMAQVPKVELKDVKLENQEKDTGTGTKRQLEVDIWRQ